MRCKIIQKGQDNLQKSITCNESTVGKNCYGEKALAIIFIRRNHSKKRFLNALKNVNCQWRDTRLNSVGEILNICYAKVSHVALLLVLTVI